MKTNKKIIFLFFFMWVNQTNSENRSSKYINSSKLFVCFDLLIVSENRNEKLNRINACRLTRLTNCTFNISIVIVIFVIALPVSIMMWWVNFEHASRAINQWKRKSFQFTFVWVLSIEWRFGRLNVI